ncbi:hypothetical protein FACS189498_1670 [Spirochaetia bacterium]|nr:hypothetical protein FACS189498_1670 [Spirochaetia bacterium]
MAAYISPKSSWLGLAVSFCVAGLAALALNFFLAGPRLGPWYDILLKYRSPPPVSHELLLIEPEEAIVDPSSLASALITMTELDAASFVVQIPVLGIASENENGEKILPQIDEEFALLSRNIRNLFNAIRVGSIAPAESGRYVQELVDLTERGKDRLTAALTGGQGEAMIRFEQSAGAFGRLLRAGDLRLGTTGEGNGLYSRVEIAGDGKFRRIAPVIYDDEGKILASHIIYSLFRGRFPGFGMEDSANIPVLINTAAAGRKTAIPLDKEGSLLIEIPRGETDFRRIPLSLFLEYENEDRILRQLLEEGEKKGIYQALEPEKYPPFLYDYAQLLQEDMLSDSQPEKKPRWLKARHDYLESVDDFLSGPAETTLVNGYEELIASGELTEAGIDRLTGLRDELIAVFRGLRLQHRKFLAARNNLEQELLSALCIMGPPSPPETPLSGRKLSEAEVSAVFANALLSGRILIPENCRFILLFSLGGALICLLCVRRRSFFVTLIVGLIFTALVLGGFSLRFVLSGIWLDPVIPGAATAAAFLTSSLWALAAKGRHKQRFRLAYKPFVGDQMLRSILRAGKPLPGDLTVSKAVIVAVRNSALTSREDRESPQDAAAAAEAFRETLSRLFCDAGAVIAGSGGDTVLAAFGSPLEAGKKAKTPGVKTPGVKTPGVKTLGVKAVELQAAVKAVEFAARQKSGVDIPDPGAWHFGIAGGECAFTWSALSGYCAYGRPAARARLLAGLGSRYKARILVSQSAAGESPGPEFRKLNTLGGKDEGMGEVFYELVL